MDFTITEKAQKAGITHEDGQFLEDIFPKLVLGMIMGLPLVTDDELRRMLSMLDKIIAVDPEAIPPSIQPAIDRLRASMQPPTTH